MYITVWWIAFALHLSANSASAVEPQQVLIVANEKVEGSVELAHYYRKMRQVPKHNVFELELPPSENISRDEFNLFQEKIFGKIEQIEREAEQENRISTVVLIYGVPLRVMPTELDSKDQEKVQQIESLLAEKKSQRDNNDKGGKNESNLIQSLQNQLNLLLKMDEIASVDSELALLHYPEHTLSGWLKNPRAGRGLNPFGKVSGEVQADDKILTVARLDGPDIDTVYRIIGDTLHAEKLGLHGKAYFDARWPEQSDMVNRSAYAQYDLSIHKAAAYVKDTLVTAIDTTAALFEQGACPETALYCGWYSLSNYIDSFDWVQGSVGYHIASAECGSLRKTDNRQWCASMLKNGAAAVIGPVAEPYVQGFPLPELFFNELVNKGRSLGESYISTVPYLSWQMVLVGDPLYVPFPQGGH